MGMSMGFLLGLFTSSIGRKVLVAVSAFGLVLFLIAHLLGNLLVFRGPETFNSYAVNLREYPFLLWFLRIALLGIFLLHMALGLQLSIENRRARPQNYVYRDTVRASLASRSMAITGLVMLAYILYHLSHFTFGLSHPKYFHLKDSMGRHDVYSMLVLSFQNPMISFTYVFALFLTLLHLSHGIPSLFQSVGWNSSSQSRNINLLGKTLALLLFVGYSSIPIAVYLGLLKEP